MTAINSLLSASSFYSLPAISKKGIQKFPSGFPFFYKLPADGLAYF
jgi:hypothetical protein